MFGFVEVAIGKLCLKHIEVICHNQGDLIFSPIIRDLLDLKAKLTKDVNRLTGIYAAADCRRGQDLVVRAINEGREAAREIDRDLTGSTQLP